MTLLGQLLSDAAIVVMDEQPDGPDVVLELLGERQGLSHQSRHPLPQRVVQTLDVTGQAAIFTDRLMPFAGNDRDIGFPKICIHLGTLAIDRWNGLPERPRRFPRTVTDVAADDLSGLGIKGQPNPLCVPFRIDE